MDNSLLFQFGTRADISPSIMSAISNGSQSDISNSFTISIATSNAVSLTMSKGKYMFLREPADRSIMKQMHQVSVVKCQYAWVEKCEKLPSLSAIWTLRKRVLSSGFSFPVIVMLVLLKPSPKCNFSISLAFRNGFWLGVLSFEEGLSPSTLRKWSDKSSFADALIETGNKHFLTNLCASISWILYNAAGSFPCIKCRVGIRYLIPYKTYIDFRFSTHVPLPTWLSCKSVQD